jgi:hypothetical protein
MVKKKSATKKKATKKVAKKSSVKKSVSKKAAVKKKAASKKKVSAEAAGKTIDNETRYKMVAEAAYHLSEQQGFEPGRDMDNWLIAEQQIEAQLKKDKIQVK